MPTALYEPRKSVYAKPPAKKATAPTGAVPYSPTIGGRPTGSTWSLSNYLAGGGSMIPGNLRPPQTMYQVGSGYYEGPGVWGGTPVSVPQGQSPFGAAATSALANVQRQTAATAYRPQPTGSVAGQTMGAGGSAVTPSQITPEAMALLNPSTAAALQAQSELEAQRMNQQFAEQSAGMLATPQVGDTGPAFPSQYWASLKRAQEGDIRARYSQLDEQIRTEGRNRNPMWTSRMLKENQDRMTEQSESARLNRAQAYLGLAQARPYQGGAYTNLEDYMRGAEYADRLMAMQQDIVNRQNQGQNQQNAMNQAFPQLIGTGIGGGTGGSNIRPNSLPAYQTWDTGVTATPNYGSGAAGGGASLYPQSSESQFLSPWDLSQSTLNAGLNPIDFGMYMPEKRRRA